MAAGRAVVEDGGLSPSTARLASRYIGPLGDIATVLYGVPSMYQVIRPGCQSTPKVWKPAVKLGPLT